MTSTPELALNTNIAAIPAVGDKRAEAFRRLGIRCVADLIRHFPSRYEHIRPLQTIAEIGASVMDQVDVDAQVSVAGTVTATQFIPGRHSRFLATLQDDTGTLLLTWFNSPWMREKLHPEQEVFVQGKIKLHDDHLQIINPRWENCPETIPETKYQERYRPIYPATEELPSSAIESTVIRVLDDALTLLEDHLHEEYRKERALLELSDAYRLIHQPTSELDTEQARYRLAFDELLLLQIGVMLKRRHRRSTLTAPALTHNQAIDDHITARFPFTLTADQRTVIDEIVGDLVTTQPMNRLLQGDVGSGKTVVALYAMLLAVAARQQAALMAPTELLAEQHYASICNQLAGSRVNIQLLTGSLSTAQRNSILDELARGDIDILIGTHALLTETVNFKSLAVAVIDEQHRFGVHQRAALRSKSQDRTTSPHVLVMTATPIPRTLSLTIFGDLDISTIRELPPGRQKIETRHYQHADADEAYQRVEKRIADGEQAYFVVPVIDESGSGLKDVYTHMEKLQQGALKNHRLEVMHGRLSRDERDQIMQRFRDGEIDALIATTVIEVGIDVPNATMMIIEHADRFGLAQLHQLRGRVGRGSKHSICLLIADPATNDGAARVEALLATQDGFEIAEKDLEIRGPGELFGARQSGIAPFMVAQFPRDIQLLQMARRDAAEWIRENPTLKGERDALLKSRLLKTHGHALGLGDVA